MTRHTVLLSLIITTTFTNMALLSTLRADDNSPASAESDSARPIRTFEELDQLAQRVAAEPFEPCAALPPDIQDLTYDDYRMMAFRPEQAIWWNEGPPFWFEMFHRGFVHKNKVSINVATKSVASRIPFSQKYFEYRGPMADTKLPADTGFAGLKVVGRFPGRNDGQEMLTFLGASYFRARTADSVYGTSARGLAINSATNGPEEFPAFREFWVVKPAKNDKSLKILALMESESVTGAYEFEFSPLRSETVLDIRSRLYFRQQPEKLGIAPLTSMWMWGDGLSAPPKDSRPSVHDSDGLLIADGTDSWTWRALSRQHYPSLSRFECTDLRGFGLMQRDTNYWHYRDDEAKYHQRPSIWIEPRSQWGAGAVELLELNGAHEGIDNVAAFWVPKEPVPLEEPVDLNYRVRIFRGRLAEHNTLARAVGTELKRTDDRLNFTVKFRGQALKLRQHDSPLDLAIGTVRGTVEERSVEHRPNGDCLVHLSVRPESTDSSNVQPVEVRLTLRDANRRLSETWCYLCAPTPPPYKYPAVYTRIE